MVKLNEQSLKEWQEKNLEHIRYEFKDIEPGEYCIDIGSYRREWADEMIHLYKVDVECFDALDNKAAWIENCELIFSGQYYYTSMYTDGPGYKYRAYDIAPYLNREVAVMKVNIEGAEYKLLNYIIEKGLHKNIRHLQVQFHEVDGMPYQGLYDIIAKELSKTHKLEWRYPYCWEQWIRKGTLTIIDETQYAKFVEYGTKPKQL